MKKVDINTCVIQNRKVHWLYVNFSSKYFYPTVVLVIFMCGTIVAQNSLSAAPEGSGVKLTWKVGSVVKVNRFEIYRSPASSDPDYRYITTIIPEEGRLEYRYLDVTMNRTSVTGALSYIIIVVNNKDEKGVETSFQIGPVTTIVASTAKRTWGSIKAMFR